MATSKSPKSHGRFLSKSKLTGNVPVLGAAVGRRPPNERGFRPWMLYYHKVSANVLLLHVATLSLGVQANTAFDVLIFCDIDDVQGHDPDSRAAKVKKRGDVAPQAKKGVASAAEPSWAKPEPGAEEQLAELGLFQDGDIGNHVQDRRLASTLAEEIVPSPMRFPQGGVFPQDQTDWAARGWHGFAHSSVYPSLDGVPVSGDIIHAAMQLLPAGVGMMQQAHACNSLSQVGGIEKGLSPVALRDIMDPRMQAGGPRRQVGASPLSLPAIRRNILQSSEGQTGSCESPAGVEGNETNVVIMGANSGVVRVTHPAFARARPSASLSEAAGLRRQLEEKGRNEELLHAKILSLSNQLVQSGRGKQRRHTSAPASERKTNVVTPGHKRRKKEPTVASAEKNKPKPFDMENDPRNAEVDWEEWSAIPLKDNKIVSFTDHLLFNGVEPILQAKWAQGHVIWQSAKLAKRDSSRQMVHDYIVHAGLVASAWEAHKIHAKQEMNLQGAHEAEPRVRSDVVLSACGCCLV